MRSWEMRATRVVLRTGVPALNPTGMVPIFNGLRPSEDGESQPQMIEHDPYFIEASPYGNPLWRGAYPGYSLSDSSRNPPSTLAHK